MGALYSVSALKLMERILELVVVIIPFSSTKEGPHKMDNPQMLFALAFMIFTAMACIFIGSKRLLHRVSRGCVDEVLKSQDAATFPITGSCVLFGLYTALKFIPKYVIGALLAGYLSIASVFALGSLLRMMFGRRVITGVVSVAVGFSYLYFGKNWILNNILAVAISITAIASLPINSFKTSSILLIGLFFYDIFWVFGTDVMVSVATGIDGPIKLLFPQTIFGSHDKKSLLGLGDIVIPGFFVSQTLVFSQMYVKRGNYYFIVALVAYFLSLVNTMGVMIVFKHAQPALLYIVPWLLISILVAAAANGELGKLFAYDVELVQPKKTQHVATTASNKKKVEEPLEEEGGLTELIWELVKELFGFGKDEDEVDAAVAPKTVKAESTTTSKPVAKPVVSGSSRPKSSSPPSNTPKIKKNN